MSRTDIKVRFLKRSHDEPTRRSFEPGAELVLPDTIAIRQVEAGNAEFVTENQKDSGLSKSEQKQQNEAQKEANQLEKDKHKAIQKATAG